MSIERAIGVQHAKGEELGASSFDIIGLGRVNGVGFQPPDKDGDAGDVVHPLGMMRIDAAHIYSMSQPIKGAIQEIEVIIVTQVQGPATPQPPLIDVLSDSKQCVELHDPCGPTSYVLCQLVDEPQGSFTPALADRVGY